MRARRWHRRRDGRDVALAVAAGLVLVVVAHSGHLPGVPAPASSAPSSAGGNVALGQQLAGFYGWSAGPQWSCLDALWTRESGWSNTATNPQSGAYGIPQSLPPDKMPAAALPPFSSASAQVSWGLGYIRATYGDPCGAWAHEETDGWY